MFSYRQRKEYYQPDTEKIHNQCFTKCQEKYRFPYQAGIATSRKHISFYTQYCICIYGIIDCLVHIQQALFFPIGLYLEK